MGGRARARCGRGAASAKGAVMLSTVSTGRIWLCTQPTDMRCLFDGLSARVRRYLGEDRTSGCWFVFVNRRHAVMSRKPSRRRKSGSGSSAPMRRNGGRSRRRRSPGSFTFRARPRGGRGGCGEAGPPVAMSRHVREPGAIAPGAQARSWNLRPGRGGRSGRRIWRSLWTDPDYVADWHAHGGPAVHEAAPYPFRRQTEADLKAAWWKLLVREDPRHPSRHVVRRPGATLTGLRLRDGTLIVKVSRGRRTK